MMPFRIPHGYETLAVCSADADADELAEYIDWLKTELETAEAYQESRAMRKEAETPTPGDR